MNGKNMPEPKGLSDPVSEYESKGPIRKGRMKEKEDER